MKKHVIVVGALRIGFGTLGILIALIVLLGTIGPGLLVRHLEGDEVPLTILTIVGGSVALFLVLTSLPGIIGGIGLMQMKPWARYLVLILAVLDLFYIPVGTAVGIYTIWVLMQDETEQLFARA